MNLHLQVSLCGIQRDEKIWGNPEEYVPERWVEGSSLEATEAQKKAFMPFGDGIRSCVGECSPASDLSPTQGCPSDCLLKGLS